MKRAIWYKLVSSRTGYGHGFRPIGLKGLLIFMITLGSLLWGALAPFGRVGDGEAYWSFPTAGAMLVGVVLLVFGMAFRTDYGMRD